MAIGLIGWGRFVDPKDSSQWFTVSAPPADPGKPWQTDFLRENAASLAASFNVLQWPPSSMAQGGTGAGCDGYGDCAGRGALRHIVRRPGLNGHRRPVQ